jgi:4-amino-4-deoxy-L-arabinose transferase-like glycosyltransferase
MIFRGRAFPWTVLAVILICFVISILREHPTNYFGLTGDDAVYFSSAKALAQGQGYVLPNVPGAPPATKYPILYSWLLSWAWRVNGSFPANLREATAITVVFGLAFITLALVFLRRLAGIGNAESLFITAFCALHPRVIFFSGAVMSDIPFAVLALAAMLAADRAMHPQTKDTIAFSSGILAGLAMLMRLSGVAVVAGILVTAIARRAWRQLFVFCGSMVPFFAWIMWQQLELSKSRMAAFSGSSLGWTRMWAYYTSYVEFWRISVPDKSVFWTMLTNNLTQIVFGTSDYFLSPLLVGNTLASRALSAMVTAAIVAGLVRHAHREEWKVIHYVAPFYVAVIVLWNYPITERNFILFLPLFSAGLWIEGKHLLRMLRGAFVGAVSPAEKVLAASIGLGVVALSGGMAWNYLTGARTVIARTGAYRVALRDEKREVYDWISHFTPSSARIIAYEDASAYLYTGRLAMPPVVFTTAELYEPARLEQTMDHMTDVARAIGAGYWIVSADDFDLEWSTARQKAHDRVAELGRTWPLAFRSRGGHVSIYSLQCLNDPNAAGCQSADRSIFPAAP